MAQENIIATGLRRPEGPAFDDEGNLYIVQERAGQVTRIDPDGSVSVFAAVGGAPSGLAFGPDRNLYLCNAGGKALKPRIERITMDGQVETLITEIDGEPLSGPNDLAFDPDGNFYFTDPKYPAAGPQAVFSEPAPGAGVGFSDINGNVRMLDLGLRFPNGISVTEDRQLLVCETQTSKVHGYPLSAPGQLGPRRIFGDLGEGAAPDGMCLDEDGYALVCGVLSGQIHVFPPGGGLQVDSIDFGRRYVTNLCFGGPNFSTLYVTLNEERYGQVLTVEWERRGMVLFPDR